MSSALGGHATRSPMHRRGEDTARQCGEGRDSCMRRTMESTSSLSDGLLAAEMPFSRCTYEEEDEGLYRKLAESYGDMYRRGRSIRRCTPEPQGGFDLHAIVGADDRLPGRKPAALDRTNGQRATRFREAVMAYYDAAFQFGRRASQRIISDTLGLQPGLSLTAYVTKRRQQLRLDHYPYFADRSDRPGIGAHTDYELFTLLLPTAPGLEVMNADGLWIDAPPVPGALVITSAICLRCCPNGRFTATSTGCGREGRTLFVPLFFSSDYSS